MTQIHGPPATKAEARFRSESLRSLMNVSLASVAKEPEMVGALPSFEVRPLIKSLNKYFAMLKGIEYTESE
jgi:hypothetical protein